MTEEVKVIKRYKSFILGFCKCNCGNEIKIITSTWEKGVGHWLQTWKNGHNRMDYSKRILPTGENHHAWKGGRRLVGSKNKRYIAIKRKHHKYCDFHGYVMEHRYRMELMLGRYLTEKEVVHHIDGNTFNNDESNLMLFASQAEHIAFELTKDMSGRKCRICGSMKTRVRIRNGKVRVEWHGNINDGFFCVKCYDKIRNKRYYKERILMSKSADF